MTGRRGPLVLKVVKTRRHRFVLKKPLLAWMRQRGGLFVLTCHELDLRGKATAEEEAHRQFAAEFERAWEEGRLADVVKVAEEKD